MILQTHKKEVLEHLEKKRNYDLRKKKMGRTIDAKHKKAMLKSTKSDTLNLILPKFVCMITIYDFMVITYYWALEPTSFYIS